MTILQRVVDGFTYAGDLNLVVMTCPTCGVTYAMPHTLQKNAHEKGHRKIDWYCPNGHELGYSGKSAQEVENDNLKRQLEWTDQDRRNYREQRDTARRALSAQKGQNTKLRKRVAAGVCPCCNRTFQNLSRHMTGQHPGYAETE